MKSLDRLTNKARLGGIIDRAAVVFADVEAVSSLTIPAILGPCQTRDVRLFRGLLYFLLTRAAGLTQKQAALVCNRRCHTTILHGARQFERHLEYDEDARDLFRYLCDMRGVP